MNQRNITQLEWAWRTETERKRKESKRKYDTYYEIWETGMSTNWLKERDKNLTTRTWENGGMDRRQKFEQRQTSVTGPDYQLDTVPRAYETPKGLRRCFRLNKFQMTQMNQT
jgi:hypothetical protein